MEIVGTVEDKTPFRQVYNPGHPDADEKGYVTMSNVDTITEMVDMISATRSYEANVTALNTSKSMLLKALEIGK
ncbi:Flagellar basal-body rod protein FlgC [bioreactor metagenome]|uniref:Flagellar basal-body rod protein FlgC n=1 Tax=bioreactor metagenome TaxID=1076179 RepID=A0A645HIC3_9ZZZZ